MTESRKKDARAARLADHDAVVEAALMHAAFDGWSKATLRNAAADAGLSVADATRLFPRGTESLLDGFDDWLDRQMMAAADGEVEAMPVRKRIAFLVRSRFAPVEHHKEATRRAVVARGWPTNLLDSGQALWRTVDRTWQAAGFTGGKADGFSHYSRRVTLAMVLVSTCLYWLEDNSEGSRESWRFLDARIEDVMRFGRFQQAFKSSFSTLPGKAFMDLMRTRMRPSA